MGWSGFGPARDEECDPIMVAELYGIYLLPEYWSMSYGKHFTEPQKLGFAKAWSRTWFLWVFEKNTRARSFYEAVGYRLESGKQKEMRFAGATTAMEVGYRKLLNGETALAMR